MKKNLLVIYTFTALLVSAFAVSCKSNDPVKTEPTKIEETTIFTTKYTQDKVWDAQRSPAYPVANEIWTLSRLINALDVNKAPINWGINRYVKFVAVANNDSTLYPIVDDLYNKGTKHTLTLKLYESNGTLVNVISSYGQIIGIGDKGFMYVAESEIGMFFPVNGAKEGDTVAYIPTTLTVTKLSELYK